MWQLFVQPTIEGWQASRSLFLSNLSGQKIFQKPGSLLRSVKMPDNRSHEDIATSGKPVSYKDDEDNDPEFVEVDPTGRYGRYNEVLGKGAFKTVYRAFDEVDGIEVAWNQVKVQDVLQSPEDLERLYSEVHLLKTLKHKNIIKFYNSWVDAKTKNVNFITEIFTSGTLRQYRKKHKHVDLKAVKSWARQILRGLLYLHSHDPPIIHRDLKCDNIFVNGNQGEVKIGDLGLAAILRQAHAAHSVIGTPEFMAPELYEEEYNELVDIYSFGMCVLEMVTFEYPYSECTNAAQIYKKVTSGKKPAALDKVKDLEVRSFVEKCLAAASRRLPARELLMDPFLQCDGDRETLDLLPPRRLQTRADDMEELNTLVDEQYRSNAYEGSGRMLKGSLPPLKLGSFVGGDSIAEDEVSNDHDESIKFTKNASFSSSRDERFRRSRDFRVKGKRREDDTIFLRLRIGDHEGHFRNIHFPFDIEADTALSVASEMVAELDLSDQDVTTIAEMIDAEILALVPDWKPGAAFDESVGIDGENSPDQPSEGFVTPQVDENSIHSKSPSEPPSLSFGPCSQSPSQLLHLNVASPARAEYTIHGRFEEVSYRSGASDHSSQSEEFPPFSSDSCDAQDDETLNGGFSHPDTPKSDCYGSSTEPPISAPIARHVKLVNGTCMQLVGAAIDEPKNSGLHDITKENWERVVLHAVQEDYARERTFVSDECKSLECPKSLDRLVFDVDHEINLGLASGAVLAANDNLEDSVAEELRTLAVRQEQELRELQHRHELALLEIQKRCQNKRSGSPLQISGEVQENNDFVCEKVDSSSEQVSTNQSQQLGGNLQGGNSASNGQDELLIGYSNASVDNSGKDQSLFSLQGLSVPDSILNEIEESSKQELLGYIYDEKSGSISTSREIEDDIIAENEKEKPGSISTSRACEADIIAQDQMGSLLHCVGLKSFQDHMEARILMEQHQLMNESRSIEGVNCDLECASNVSETENQEALGCDLLSKGFSEESIDSTSNPQHIKSFPSKVMGTAADCCSMRASLTWNSELWACDVKKEQSMPAGLIAQKATSDMDLETPEEVGPRVAALPIVGHTHLASVKVESLVQNRRESFVEYYKAGCLEKEKSCPTKGVLKGLEVPQIYEANLNTARLESTEANRLEQLKKEQLQKSIAELEARTLQGLHSSQTRYSINKGKKSAGGSTYGGQTALSKSQVRQQTAAEPNKA